MKYLIFDAGPLISLAMAGHLKIIEQLKKDFDGHFILTPQVKEEVITRPMKIAKYRLEAIQVQDLLDRGILELSTKFVSNNTLEKETKNILRKTNNTFSTKHHKEKVVLIHEGEASCLAFSELCNCKTTLVVDERTTRLLSEAPHTLKKIMEKKLHQHIEIEQTNTKKLQTYTFIRSTELMYIAYKKGYIPLKKNKKTLDALLNSLKFKGTAISTEEIETMKRLA